MMHRVGELARAVAPGRSCAVIADDVSDTLFGDRVTESLVGAHFRVVRLSIPPGEASKSVTQLERICDEMVSAGLDRSSFILGLGGGVVGDLSGFVAAVFHR